MHISRVTGMATFMIVYVLIMWVFALWLDGESKPLIATRAMGVLLVGGSALVAICAGPAVGTIGIRGVALSGFVIAPGGACLITAWRCCFACCCPGFMQGRSD